MRKFLGVVLAACLAAPAAHAFCGFYVGGSGQSLFNNATLVVLMRDGARTVMAMQNNYQGPPESFALVIPVPVVLHKENVKTLDKAIFARVEQLAAPRLVEYWEQDPCMPPRPPIMYAPRGAMADGRPSAQTLGVKIEAQFVVGEYEIVILSAKESTGLDTWLRQEKYNIPAGAEPVLRPYVASGMKFFVAKVDVKKVKMENGQAMLSPLRFHYDTDSFNLPVRLGLINSRGKQDLLVNILAPGKRYEVANYPNVTIPTNLEVTDATRHRFPEFYAALFDATLEKHPGAVVTEYSWQATSCDPCPQTPLQPDELATLGADALPSQPSASDFVLTRLHARYGKDTLGQDLVFKEASPIVGGREVMRGRQLEQGAEASGANNFQGRYIIRHPWTGPVACPSPRRGVWGGPPGGSQPRPSAATDLAFAPRGKLSLKEFLKTALPAK